MLSVVIPTLNETANLERTVRHTRRAAGRREVEIVVSDCDSADGTADLARRAGVERVVMGGCCRASAMNRGAAAARGAVLLFLHADSLVPEEFDQRIDHALRRDVRTVGGAFDFQFAVDETESVVAQHCLEWVVLLNRARFRWTGNFYGDQSIFVRRDVFDRAGGFPHLKLMEDIHFSRRMRRHGRTVILRPAVVTSPRRFIRTGVVRQFAADLMLLGCDSLGMQPRALWRHYNALNGHQSR